MKKEFKILAVGTLLSLCFLFFLNHDCRSQDENASDYAPYSPDALYGTGVSASTEGDVDAMMSDDSGSDFDPGGKNTAAQQGPGSCPGGDCSASAGGGGGGGGKSCASGGGGGSSSGGGNPAMAAMMQALQSMMASAQQPQSSAASTPTTLASNNTNNSSTTNPTNSSTSNNTTVASNNGQYYQSPSKTPSSLKSYQDALPTVVPIDDMGCSEAANDSFYLTNGKHPFDYATSFEQEVTGQVTISSDDWKNILDNDLGMKRISENISVNGGVPLGYTTPCVGDTFLIERPDGSAHIMRIGDGEIIDQRQRPISKDAFAEEIGAGSRVTIWRDDRYFTNNLASLPDASEYDALNKDLLATN